MHMTINTLNVEFNSNNPCELNIYIHLTASDAQRSHHLWHSMHSRINLSALGVFDLTQR